MFFYEEVSALRMGSGYRINSVVSGLCQVNDK